MLEFPLSRKHISGSREVIMSQKLAIRKNARHHSDALWWKPLFSFQRGVNDTICAAVADFIPPTFTEAQARTFAMLQENLHRLFSESFNNRQLVTPWYMGKHTRPHVNIEETPKGYVVRAGVAGTSPEDLDVSFADSALIIAGCLSEGCGKENGAYIHHECRDEPFSRTVALPADADMARASAFFDKGLLIVDIPKKSERPANISRLDVVPAGGGKSGQASSPKGKEAA